MLIVRDKQCNIALYWCCIAELSETILSELMLTKKLKQKKVSYLDERE